MAALIGLFYRVFLPRALPSMSDRWIDFPCFWARVLPSHQWRLGVTEPGRWNVRWQQQALRGRR